jgi:hypothetical protein
MSYTFSQIDTISGTITDLKTHNGIVYACLSNSIPPNIYRYDLSGTGVYEPFDVSGCGCLDVTDSYIYVGLEQTPGIICQIDNSGVVVRSTVDQTMYVYSMVFSTTTNRLYFTLASKSNIESVYYIDISGSLQSSYQPVLAYTVPNTNIVSLLFVGSVLYAACNGPDTATTGLFSVNITDPSGNLVKVVDISNNTFDINSLALGPPNNSRIYTIQNYPDGIRNIYELSGNTFNEITNITLPSIGVRCLTFNNDYMYLTSGVNLYKSNSPFCFNQGTKILYLNQELFDEYVPIEQLQLGDYIKTSKHDYRKIIKIITGSFYNNPNNWNMCMYKMTKTDSNGLIEDLIVTGGHSILVDSITKEQQAKYDEMGLTDFSKITIDGKHLLLACVSDQFTAMQDNDMYTYYHLLLNNDNDEEERFGIYANGILTETPNEKTLQ